MDSKSLFVYGLMATGALMSGVDADLRMASQPRNNYVVRQRNPVQFVTKTALYIEPSAFEYKGLEAQRQNAYDNFLRSNIDNEQDKRDFNREAGRDMLPVRSFEAAETSSSATPASAQSQTKLPAGAAGAITATPGQAVIVPLRWNNPHAAELEVNVWINDMKIVVPVKKPTCAGEGHQDAVFEFTIPADWNTAVPAAVPSFTGCKQVGDCVLQIYAHSVEPRQYAIGTPLIITGTLGPAGATQTLAPAGVDPGTDISKQPNDICLSSASDAANIKNAVPRVARQISDVANHAYQNNNYSPYSGQQPEAISKNLQASVIISMIPANRGELGRTLLQDTNAAGAAFAANLRTKEQNLVKQYEGIVNNIIAKIGNANMKNTATVGDNNEQKLATTFRAAEVGSVTTTRLTTNTYVPSFQLPAAQVAAARALVPAKYAGLIDANGQVKIYEAVLNDLKGEFNKAKALGIDYLGPVIKDTAATLTDATQFKKLNAAGGRDGGRYATAQFQKAQAARLAAAKAAPAFTVTTTPLQKVLEADFVEFGAAELATGTDAQQDFTDPDQMYSDCATDTDADETATECKPYQLFTQSADDSGLVVNEKPATPASSNSNAATTTVASSIIAFTCSAIAAIFLA